MAAFVYQGFDRGGKATKGVIDAETAKAARSKLRSQGIFPSNISEQQAGKVTTGTGLNIEIDFKKVFQRVSPADLADMTGQLGTLINAGIPLVDAFNALVDQTENPKLKLVLVEIREQINQGDPLHKAMRKHPSVFSTLYVNMVAAGEQSGALDTVLRRLTEYTENSVKMRNELVGALTYPVLMGVISLGVVAALFLGVIPRIRRMFDSFNATLPWITRVILAFSDFLQGYWWAIAIVAVGAFFWFRRWIKTESGKERWHRFLINVPVFGPINRLVEVSRFCRTFSTLLASGVPIITAINITESVIGNSIIKKAISGASKNISEGESIARPLKDSGEFPPLVTHMIAIGEKTGDLEPMLQKVADSYDTRVENTLKGLTATLEPIMIVSLGGIVMVVALSILLPMLNMSAIAR